MTRGVFRSLITIVAARVFFWLNRALIRVAFVVVVRIGEHMIDVFNEIGVDVATPGNHDFDFGIDALISAIDRSKFPWILVSLVFRPDSPFAPSFLAW